MMTNLALLILYFLGTIVVAFQTASDANNYPSAQKNRVVSSLSPPRRHQKLIISIAGHGRVDNGAGSSYGYSVVERCPIQTIIAKNSEATADGGDRNINKKKSKEHERDLNIIDALLEWNPNGRFPSKTQARRSLDLGKVLLFNTTSATADVSDIEACVMEEETMHKDEGEDLHEINTSLRDLQSYIACTASVLDPHAVFVLVEPIPSPDRYPQTVTKYMFPPVETIGLVPIIYEDNHMAVVNKPENMTTIGSTTSSSTDDLQSVLGFLLKPSPFDPAYHPRPVHRLDRRTSGLVLVAKTQSSMRMLSRAFATRTVTKTYSALVFERDRDLSARLGGDISSSDETEEWLVVDYPIENREAISEIRRVSGPSSQACLSPKQTLASGNNIDNDEDFFYNTISLVEVRPKTGRTHQIRRHLSYCLGMPIVGDSKYDGGARHLRTNGMYLCCHSLRFPYICSTTSEDDMDAVHISQDATVEWIHANSHGDGPIHDTLKSVGSQLSIRIPLPDKFCHWEPNYNV